MNCVSIKDVPIASIVYIFLKNVFHVKIFAVYFYLHFSKHKKQEWKERKLYFVFGKNNKKVCIWKEMIRKLYIQKTVDLKIQFKS